MTALRLTEKEWQALVGAVCAGESLLAEYEDDDCCGAAAHRREAAALDRAFRKIRKAADR